MRDADRYQQEFDQMMQDLEAEATKRSDADRAAAWKKLGRSFNKLADTMHWTPEEREIRKQRYLDMFFAD